MSAPGPGRLIGLGEPFRGDDGVGHAVVCRLAARAEAEGWTTHLARDAASILELLGAPGTVVLVDAVASAGPPGRVLSMAPDAFAGSDLSPMSSHALGVIEALELARVLHDGAGPTVRIVGVTVAPRIPLDAGLGAAVEAAIPEAIRQVAVAAGWGPDPAATNDLEEDDDA